MHNYHSIAQVLNPQLISIPGQLLIASLSYLRPTDKEHAHVRIYKEGNNHLEDFAVDYCNISSNLETFHIISKGRIESNLMIGMDKPEIWFNRTQSRKRKNGLLETYGMQFCVDGPYGQGWTQKIFWNVSDEDNISNKVFELRLLIDEFQEISEAHKEEYLGILNPLLLIFPENVRELYNIPQSISDYPDPLRFSRLFQDYESLEAEQTVASFSAVFGSPSSTPVEWNMMMVDKNEYLGPYNGEIIYSWSAGVGRDLLPTGSTILNTFLSSEGAEKSIANMSVRESSGRIIMPDSWMPQPEASFGIFLHWQSHFAQLLRNFQFEMQKKNSDFMVLFSDMKDGEVRYLGLE